MLIVAEYIMLGEPEPHCPNLAKPLHELIAAPDVACHGMNPGDMPHNIVGNEGR